MSHLDRHAVSSEAGRASERAGAELSGARAPPSAAPAPPAAGAARVPMQMSPGGRGGLKGSVPARSGWSAARRKGTGFSHGDDLGAKPWDSTRRVVASS